MDWFFKQNSVRNEKLSASHLEPTPSEKLSSNLLATSRRLIFFDNLLYKHCNSPPHNTINNTIQARDLATLSFCLFLCRSLKLFGFGSSGSRHIILFETGRSHAWNLRNSRNVPRVRNSVHFESTVPMLTRCCDHASFVFHCNDNAARSEVTTPTQIELMCGPCRKMDHVHGLITSNDV